MSKHKRYGGSTADRTIHCPPWHKLADTVPPAPESEYAQIGTALHACIEQLMLSEDPTPASFIGAEIMGVQIDAALVNDKLIPAWLAWHELCDKYGIEEYEPEVAVQVNENIGGTADVIAAVEDATIVVDFKFGDGIQVYPEENAQGLHYALCGSRTKSVEDLFLMRNKVIIVIIQPNNRGEDTLRIWETTFERVRQFEATYIVAVNQAETADIEDPEQFLPGSHCKFCPGEAICPVKTGLVAEQARFDPMSKHPATLADALEIAEEMEDWIAAVRKMAHEQMEQGVEIPRFKLVAKRGRRVWNSTDEVEELVRKSRKIKSADAYNETLLSPAQMEAMCKEHGVDFGLFEEHISMVSSGTTIAPESDKRPAVPAVKALKAIADRN